ncbi:MAG: formylglycine-generating enzyme family protein, partial [Planctomycetes bacterium]|nr:formylglycine-generating enzyme family protein [Planctomycetota bacterium]
LGKARVHRGADSIGRCIRRQTNSSPRRATSRPPRRVPNLRELLKEPLAPSRSTCYALAQQEPILAQEKRPVLGRRRLDSPMVLVPEGEFLIGEHLKTATVKAFEIDVYLVTNEQYERFVIAEKHDPPEHWDDASCPDELRDHPVTHVNWQDVKDYAEWIGKRLPTELEWEKAARGTDGRMWPWGSKFEPKCLNCAESKLYGTTPVTQYPSGRSPYGCYDMAGNVWEWVGDVNSKKEPTLRGGCWSSYQVFTRCFASHRRSPQTKSELIGFRCCRDVG